MFRRVIVKKVILKVVIILFLFAITPTTVLAGVYTDKDISISLNDVIWETISKDGSSSIINKKTYELLYQAMIRLDAFLVAQTFSFDKNEMVMVCTKISAPEISNLHSYNNVGDVYVGDYTIINNNYTYLYEEYEREDNINAIVYTTNINQEEYRIEIRKFGKFKDIEKKEIRNIIDNITFNVNPLYNFEVESETERSLDNTSNLKVLLEAIGAGAGYFVIISMVVWLFNKNKAKEKSINQKD